MLVVVKFIFFAFQDLFYAELNVFYANICARTTPGLPPCRFYEFMFFEFLATTVSTKITTSAISLLCLPSFKNA